MLGLEVIHISKTGPMRPMGLSIVPQTQEIPQFKNYANGFPVEMP